MTTRWPHCGAILAGGASRRMGREKAAVPLWDGRPMLAHVLEALQAVCRRVVVVGAVTGYRLPDEVIVLPDLQPGQGPLAGLEALLASGLDSHYLVTACDQPLLTPALLGQLLGETAERVRVFAPADGACQPFPGLYLAAWLPAVRQALAREERGLCRLLQATGAERVPLAPADAPALRSLNTPADLAAAWPAHSGEV